MQLKEYYIWIVTSYLEFCRDAADARAGAVAYSSWNIKCVCRVTANSKRMYGPIF